MFAQMYQNDGFLDPTARNLASQGKAFKDSTANMFSRRIMPQPSAG